jgi:FMN reductase
MAPPLHIVGIGGTIRAHSTTDKALAWMMAAVEARGARTSLFKGADLDLPLYDPTSASQPDARLAMYLEAVRTCDALVVASPVYHGGPSGVVKNALDHLQPLMDDDRPYLTGRAVCCIAAGGGLPGAASTLSALRDVVHALRGWPTPMQVPINSTTAPFDAGGACMDAKLLNTLDAALINLMTFAGAMKSWRDGPVFADRL